MAFPAIFVSFDMKFYKVMVLDANVSPLKEIMAHTDNIHVADSSIYFMTTLNHTLLAALFCGGRIPYEVMNLTSDQVVYVMSNRVQYTQTFKELCTSGANIFMFHSIFKFYETCLKDGHIESTQTQTLIPSSHDRKEIQQPLVEEILDVDMDHLLEEWTQQNPGMDVLDNFLDKFEFEEIPLS